MMKGYWIAHVVVHDPQAYNRYREANAIAFAKYGGRFLVRGGESVHAKGSLKERHVVIEFPSYQIALDCLHSSEYAQAVKHRDVSMELDLVVVEGYGGPQPGEA
jgi:uncharacterized protein (DUF1330 family)